MKFLQNFKLSGASDADWAGEQDTESSRTGYVIFMGHAAVVWCSNYKSQLPFFYEAEYIALLQMRDMIWCRTLLAEMGFAMKSHQSFLKIKLYHQYRDIFKQHPGIKHIENQRTLYQRPNLERERYRLER
jgi:hypothetical protein